MQTPEQEQILDLIKNILNAGPLSIHNYKHFRSKEDILNFRDSYIVWLEANIYPQLNNLKKTL